MADLDGICRVDNPKLLSPLVLAFAGDTVYDLFVRTMLIRESACGVDKLHKTATTYVKCSAQAERFKAVEPMLTEEELAVFKRGRNAKSRPPKNADLNDYRIATGVEALIGYIFLSGDYNRLTEIMNTLLG